MRRAFADSAVLEQMLSKYQKGDSLFNLGLLYGCDHTSILYQVRKHGLYVPNRKIARPTPDRVLSDGSRFDRTTYAWSCCGSHSQTYHRVHCVHAKKSNHRRRRCAQPNRPYRPKINRVPLIIDPADQINQGKNYSELLAEQARRRMLRYRCASKVSAYGIPIGRLSPQRTVWPSKVSQNQDQVPVAPLLLDGISEIFD